MPAKRLGRPRTTGSRSTPVVSFRLSAADHARLTAEAKRSGYKPNVYARLCTLVHLA